MPDRRDRASKRRIETDSDRPSQAAGLNSEKARIRNPRKPGSNSWATRSERSRSSPCPSRRPPPDASTHFENPDCPATRNLRFAGGRKLLLAFPAPSSAPFLLAGAARRVPLNLTVSKIVSEKLLRLANPPPAAPGPVRLSQAQSPRPSAASSQIAGSERYSPNQSPNK